jgi:hypothetical protein
MYSLQVLITKRTPCKFSSAMYPLQILTAMCSLQFVISNVLYPVAFVSKAALQRLGACLSSAIVLYIFCGWIEASIVALPLCVTGSTSGPGHLKKCFLLCSKKSFFKTVFSKMVRDNSHLRYRFRFGVRDGQTRE